MEYAKERILLDKKYPFDMYRSAGRLEKASYLHFHDCLELNFVEAGRGSYLIERATHPIAPGDIFVINNLERHMAYSDGNLSLLVMVFEPDFVWGKGRDFDYLRPFFHRNSCFSNRICPGRQNYGDLEAAISRIWQEWQEQREGYRLMIQSMLLFVLATLSRHYLEQREIGDEARSFRHSFAHIRPAVEYLQEHFKETVTLEQLAAASLMNKSYLSTCFAEVMGMPPFAYLNSLRVNYACMLLRTTSMPVTEIGMLSGFNSASYFNRIFKECMGKTPVEYRKGKE